MNASLHRDDRQRDKNLKNFTETNNLRLPENYPIKPTFFHHNGKYSSLRLPENYPIKPTFFHHNGKYSSQIDYVLCDPEMLELSPDVEIHINVEKKKKPQPKLLAKPKWNRCDKQNYIATIGNTLNFNRSINVDENIEKLEKLLPHAGKETIPGYNKQVSLKPTGRSIWNSQINEALQESKKAF